MSRNLAEQSLVLIFILVVPSCQVGSVNLNPKIRRCSEVRTKLDPRATDGEYIIYIRNNVGISLYCYGLQSRSGGPKEYLTLKAGRSSNFASVYQNVGSSNACADVYPRQIYAERGRTEFNKIAIDVETFTVNTGDFTFANSSSDGKNIRYATAGDKWTYSPECAPMGTFQIDLSGTPFMPVQGTQWPLQGLYANKSVISGIANVETHKYIGCYKDTTERLLPAARYDAPSHQNISACISHCRYFGYAYAGMEYSVECHCGNFESRYSGATLVSDTNCDKKCAGDQRFTCGGTWYISIYSTAAPQVYTGRCGGYPGQCSPITPENPTMMKLQLDIMNNQHICIVNNPCQNEGLCIATTSSGYACQCQPDYTGKNCEVVETTKVINGRECPAGFQAEACQCQWPRCAGAYFAADTCLTTDTFSKITCRPSQPSHVTLFNVRGRPTVQCPDGSDIVGCSYRKGSDHIRDYGKGVIQNGTCKGCPTCTMYARCKKYLCGCKNGGRCNKLTGECECPPSYYGTECEKFDYCAYYEDRHNGTSPCQEAGVCVAVHKETVHTSGGDNAGDYCIFPFDYGDQTYNYCVQDNQVGPPFACGGDFHMSSSYIDLGPWSPGPKYTIAAWVRPGVIDTIRRTIAGGASDCNDFGFNLNSGTFRGFLKLSKECTRDLDAGKPIVSVGKWYMVAVTSNATHASIYQNGELRETNTVLMNHIPTTAGFWIGGEKCCRNDFFHGLIKTVKVWNRDLGPDEINRSMYNIGISNTTTEALHEGLVGHWELGEEQLPPCVGPAVVDHGGEDWTLKDGQYVSGTHCNISKFYVPEGVTGLIQRYNGTAGGMLDVTARVIQIDGYIDGVGAGYRGGVTSSNPGDSGQQGESYTGQGSKSTNENRGGGGGGIGGSSVSDRLGLSGGGGGYGTSGSPGSKPGISVRGLGAGGRYYGDKDLNHLYMGSGGGSGGNAQDLKTNPKGGNGGGGGAAIRLTAAESVTVKGTVSVAGGQGQGDVQRGSDCMACPDSCNQKSTLRCHGNSTVACWDMSGPGGGGSGGSIYISAKVVNVGNKKLLAIGGDGGAGASHCCGGNGGTGRIRVDSIIFQGVIARENGDFKRTTLRNLFVDHSQTGQRQIDYTSTMYGNEVFRGCFAEVGTGNRTLAVSVSTTVSIRNKMTPGYCKQLCRQKNFMYSGTQNGNECYCDNHLDMNRKAADDACNLACVGDPLQKCGGLQKLQVFGPPPSAPGVGYSVVPKCEPWCVTADAHTQNPKWGTCNDRNLFSVSSWGIQCQCPPGLTGDMCDQPCPTFTYGISCRRNCSCDVNNTAECNPSNGRCHCKPGYQGKNCDKKCSEGSFGEGCKGTCNCAHNSQCHHETGTCSCKPGWSGPNCNFPCPRSKFGPGCNSTCSCNHGSCSPEDGTCNCDPGYELPNCYQRCDPTNYGKNCMTPCDCNGQFCDAVTGSCRCGPGYMGPKCEMQCPFGSWGQSCAKKCPCTGGFGCDHVTGECQCGPGFIGENCEMECPDSTFGSDCTGTCQCIKNQSSACSSVNGQCFCLPGYTGVNCERTCPSGYYGHNCHSRCTCKNGATCNPTTGACTCAPGFIGSTCNLQCTSGNFGFKCLQYCPSSCPNGECNVVDGSCSCTSGVSCTCPNNTAGTLTKCNTSCGCLNGQCNPHTNKCLCSPGWTGDLCDTPCVAGKYGAGCKTNCRCVHGDCDPATGACYCRAGYTGNFCTTPCSSGKYGPNCRYTCKQCGSFSYPGCDLETGACRCSDGYTGPNCDRRCPLGTFGSNCTKTCSCQNGGLCDSVTGACLCAPGYKGPKCESTCPSGTWGQNCSSSCSCGIHGNGCTPEEGVCICKPGYTGVECQESCPVETYGQNCSSRCTCSPLSSVCSPIDGSCLCHPGYKGDMCDEVCEYGYWGQGCSQPCQCNTRGSCNPFTGVCDCDIGYTGKLCQNQCAQDIYWGKNCGQLCACNGAHCDHRTGVCTCSPGHTGHHCEQNCDSDHFGFQCAQLCGCKNGAKCDHVTGQCECQAGWSGKYCSEPCPDGYYGIDCKQECPDCYNGGSCDTFTGVCNCPADLTGPDCNVTLLMSPQNLANSKDQQTVLGDGIQLTTGQLAGIIAGLLLLTLVVSSLIFVVTRRYYTGRFGRTEGAVKFQGEEVNIMTVTKKSRSTEGGFVNPVHEMGVVESPDLDQKSQASEATSGVASCMVDSDDEQPKYFKDSAA